MFSKHVFTENQSTKKCKHYAFSINRHFTENEKMVFRNATPSETDCSCIFGEPDICKYDEITSIILNLQQKYTTFAVVE